MWMKLIERCILDEDDDESASGSFNLLLLLLSAVLLFSAAAAAAAAAVCCWRKHKAVRFKTTAIPAKPSALKWRLNTRCMG